MYHTKCLMNDQQIEDLWQFIAGQDFQDIKIDEDVTMSVCDVPEEIKELITKEVIKLTGVKLKPIVIYTRYNDEEVDTSFRVHSDGSVMGQEVAYASVLYLTTGETGTALLRHPEYGSISKGNIYTEDDGKWQVYDFAPEVENSMVVYPAARYHSRWPAKSKSERFVIVGFFGEV